MLSTVEKMARNDQTGYIFAKCKGERAHTISQIEHIPNVESCTPVTGRFDLVIKLGTNEPTKAFTTVEKIRNIPSFRTLQNPLFLSTKTSEDPRQVTVGHLPVARRSPS